MDGSRARRRGGRLQARAGPEMFRPVEVSARLPGAPALLVVHADGDAAVLGDGDRVVGVSEAALALGPVASPALILTADLEQV